MNPQYAKKHDNAFTVTTVVLVLFINAECSQGTELCLPFGSYADL